MSIPLLPPFRPMASIPSFYDTESVTIHELAAKLHSKMNELISEYNTFVENVNTKVDGFTTEQREALETFNLAIRQEFQDFIDIVDMKMKDQNYIIAEINERELEQILNNELEGV